jgi:excinuclease ABC subunit A
MVDAVLALPEDTKLMILAPVAREKKGEFTELFAEMQAQGYVRFRVDGQIVRPTRTCRKLKKTEKHDIDVVIDRVKVRPDLQQRLAESIPKPPCFEAPAEGRMAALCCAGDGHAAGAPVQRQVRLPGVQLLARRAGAAPVLVQLAHGRLPGVRRPGPAARCSTRRAWWPSPRSAWPAAPSRAGTGATATTSRCSRAWPSTTRSTSRRRLNRCPRPVQHAILHGSGEEEIKFSYILTAAPPKGKKSPRSTPSRASCPTWRAATARPIRWWCAKTWRATAAPSPAPNATACACAARPAM